MQFVELMDNKSNLKKTIPVVLSNVFETYDFCLYGVLAPVFAKIFFPANFKHSLLAAFALFSIAYISRPLGAVLWGQIADKYGRKLVLIGTLAMMAIPAIGMACIPTYEYIGMTATIIILLLRFLQGLALGGEYPAVMVVLYELAPDNRKGLFGSFSGAFAFMGHLIGFLIMTIISSLLISEQIEAWGWRIPFLLSIVFIFLIGYIRLSLIETIPVSSKKIRSPLLMTFKYHWKSMVKVTLYTLAPTCLFFNFIFYSYVLIQKNHNLVFSAMQIFFIQSLLTLYSMILIPCMGYLSDKIGRVKLTKFAFIMLILFCIPTYYLLLAGKLHYVIMGYIVLGLLVAMVVGPFYAIIVDQADLNLRVSTIGISYNVAIILGSFTLTINEFFVTTLNTYMAPALYIVLCCTISLITLLTMKNKQKVKREY